MNNKKQNFRQWLKESLKDKEAWKKRFGDLKEFISYPVFEEFGGILILAFSILWTIFSWYIMVIAIPIQVFIGIFMILHSVFRDKNFPY